MLIKQFFTLLFTISFIAVFAQKTTFKTLYFETNKLHSTNTVQNKKDFNAKIINLEMPNPNGDSYRAFLNKQKAIAKKRFPTKTQYQKRSNTSSTPTPIMTNSYGMVELDNNGNEVPIYGGLPNDNTFAISNDGLALMAVNSNVYLIDTKNDSILYPNETLTLRNVFELGFGSYYDPKVIYDKTEDRFVLVFLKNNNPASSMIIVGFSKTNNPIDGWNVYELPGNPLNNNRWTDFPTIALSDQSLFFTGNLIIPNVSWQLGFDGSILWEMDKFAGYQGDSLLDEKLYFDIKHDEKYIRNMHCIQGADGNVENFHLFSNRNFDIENDTIFLVSLKEESDTSFLEVEALTSDINYGVPPNARQEDTDTADPTGGLQTNDARVLGAIQFEDEIQFTSTTMNPETGFAAIYHGVLKDLYTEPTITATIIGDMVKDFGYPNIAWTGNEDCDRETMIAFNHTSFVDFPGISALYYDNEGNYSDVIELKKGEGIVNRLFDDYERWGDYFGMQRKYNEPGKVYTFGMTADDTEQNYGWVNELISPDTNIIGFTTEEIKTEDYCGISLKLIPHGGIPPYSVDWGGNSTNTDLVSDNFCRGDSIDFILSDSRNCQISGQYILNFEEVKTPFTLFPNPTNDILAFQFYLENAGLIKVNITDLKGSFVKQIVYQETKKGLNELYFSTEPLPPGYYFVQIIHGTEILSKEKFLKK